MTMMRTMDVLQALAEPTRLMALRLLWDGHEHCICELMRVLDVSQSRMSRHMAVLKKTMLVVDRRDAQWVRYKRNPHLAKDTQALIQAVFVHEPHAFKKILAEQKKLHAVCKKGG